MDRAKVRDILTEYDVQLNIVHDDTKIDDVAGKLGGLAEQLSVPMLPLMGMMRDTFARMGVKTSKNGSRTYSDSYKRVVAALALSVNRNRMDLQQMLDVDSGAYFEVAIPASVASGEGTFKIFIVDGESIQVNAEIEIPGQLQSWGKGTALVDNLFKGIDDYLKIIKR